MLLSPALVGVEMSLLRRSLRFVFGGYMGDVADEVFSI